MLLKSPYPDPPPTPGVNVHHFVFHRPEQADWKDYTLYIDAKTSRKTTFCEFVSLVQLGATALGAPVDDGCLGLHNDRGDISWDHKSQFCGMCPWRLLQLAIFTDRCPCFQEYIVLIHSLLAITTPFALIPSHIPFELDRLIKLSKCTCLFVHAQLLRKVLPVAKNAGIPSNYTLSREQWRDGAAFCS